MDNGMEYVDKCVGFTKAEFGLLAMAYGIRQIICLEAVTGTGIPQDKQQEECNKALFGLFKKGLLKPEENGLEVTQDARDLFHVIRECRVVLTIESKKERTPNICMYFSGKDYFVIMRPGSRGEEYITLERMPVSRLLVFLKEGDYLLQESLSDKLMENRQEYRITGSAAALLQEKKDGADEVAKMLWKVPEVEALYMFRDPVTGSTKRSIALLHQPLQDKILYIEESDVKILVYSEQEIRRILGEILEDEHGIG